MAILKREKYACACFVLDLWHAFEKHDAGLINLNQCETGCTCICLISSPTVGHECYHPLISLTDCLCHIDEVLQQGQSSRPYMTIIHVCGCVQNRRFSDKEQNSCLFWPCFVNIHLQEKKMTLKELKRWLQHILSLLTIYPWTSFLPSSWLYLLLLSISSILASHVSLCWMTECFGL